MDIRLRSTILRCTYPALPYPHHLPLLTDTQGAHHWPHARNGNFPWSVGYLSLPCTHHTAACLFPFRPNFEKRAQVRELAAPHCVLGHVVISGKAWELWSVMYHIEKKTSHTLGLTSTSENCEQKGRRPISVQQGSFWRFLTKAKNLGHEHCLSKFPLSPCWKRGAASTQGLSTSWTTPPEILWIPVGIRPG